MWTILGHENQKYLIFVYNFSFVNISHFSLSWMYKSICKRHLEGLDAKYNPAQSFGSGLKVRYAGEDQRNQGNRINLIMRVRGSVVRHRNSENM